jgi:ElaA protein
MTNALRNFNIQWQWARFEALSARQIYALFAVRQAVFIVEQVCAYQDMDERDADAEHLLAWSGDTLAGCLRLLAPGQRYAESSLGRILTAFVHRGIGLGRELVIRGLQRAQQRYPEHGVRIAAQARLGRFYVGFGFVPSGAPYLEDGILHIDMLKPAPCR